MLDTQLEEKLRKHLKGEIPVWCAYEKMRANVIHGNGFRKPFKLSPKEGAVLILLYREDKYASDWKFPLIQRPPYQGVNGGQISFPGGKKDIEDRDLLQTARWETQEEIGVSGADIRIIGSLSKLDIEVSNHVVLPIIGFMDQKPIFTPHPYEVAEIIEISLVDLFKKDVVKEKDLNIGGVTLRVPYYDVDDHFIWGATAMIINELATIIKKACNFKLDISSFKIKKNS